MNWNSPSVCQSLRDLRETLGLQGRDSRVVRWAYVYSRCKKRVLSGFRQFLCGLGGKRAKNPHRLRVFFYLPGGMGDAACARRLVGAYRALLPGAEFEIYSPFPQAVKTVFGDWPDVTEVSSGVYWKNYDLAVFACLTAKFLHADEMRLASLAPQFLPVFERAVKAQALLGGLLEDPFLTEPALGRWLLQNGGRRFDLLSFTGGVELAHDAPPRRVVQAGGKVGLVAGSYVTFHDGASRTESHLPTRFWPQAHWREFLRLFKENFPEIQLVQLGGKNAPVYPEADICLAGKTELADLPEILNGALCHVDTESGLVHLAQFLAVRSVVLFGPSDVRFFGYDKNKNLSAGDCGGCMWMSTDWMTRCPLAREEALCMQNITPQQVLDAVREIVSVRR